MNRRVASINNAERERLRLYLCARFGQSSHMAIDRPIGYRHPSGIVYLPHYGYLPRITGGDNEEQDAYLLHVTKPIAEATAYAVVLILREDDCEDKLVLSPEKRIHTVDKIEEAVQFQEQYFRHTILLWKV